MALACWCALNTVSFIWSEEVKSDVTMTPRSRHELTYYREAPLMDNDVLGTVFQCRVHNFSSLEK